MVPLIVGCHTTTNEYQNIVENVDIKNHTLNVRDINTNLTRTLDFSTYNRGTNRIQYENFTPGDTIGVVIQELNGTFYASHRILFMSDWGIGLKYNQDSIDARKARAALNQESNKFGALKQEIQNSAQK
jgi:hypothetical protein